MNDVRLMIRPGLRTNRTTLPVAGCRRKPGSTPGRARLSASFELPISGEELALRIREMREYAGITAVELGQRIGVSDKTIWAVSDPKFRTSGMDLSLLVKICDACGFELARVIAREWVSPAPWGETADRRERLRALRRV